MFKMKIKLIPAAMLANRSSAPAISIFVSPDLGAAVSYVAGRLKTLKMY
jgi:hypothetical protein